MSVRFFCLALMAVGLAAAPAADAGHWPLAEGAGLVARDVSPGANHAHLRGGAKWLEQEPGLEVLALDGVDGWLEVPHHPGPSFAGDFTLSLWLAVRSRQHIVGLAVKPGVFRLLYYPEKKKFLIDLIGQRRHYATFAGELPQGRWCHLAIVRHARAGQTEVFVNGGRISLQLDNAGPLSGSNAPLRIGAGADLKHPRYLQGAVAELRFEARAFSHEEIQRMADELDERLKEGRDLALPVEDVRSSQSPLLMVDKTQIAVNDGVSLTVCEAGRHPNNPIIRLGGPGSVDEARAQFGGSVYYLDGKFRMWYHAFPGGPAYAESDDGIHWNKPNLGLKSFRGSTENNLVPMPGGAMIFHDPSDPERRFKKPVYKPNPSRGNRHSLWTWAHSKDGFHWSLVDRPGPEKWENAEAQMLAKVRDQWVIYTQGLTDLGRTVMAFHSPSLDIPTWEWKKKPVWALKDKYPLYQTHHGISPWPRPGLTIGLCGIFLDRHELIDTTVDLGLVLSRDGFEWWEPWPLATVLRRGPAGAWDSTFLIQGCPSFVNVRDKTFLYYSGSDAGNEGDRMQVGLATLRRDGFGYLGLDIGWSYTQPGPRAGSFTTVPIQVHDKASEQVLLNVENLGRERQQYLKAELLDGRGRPLAGYSLNEADPITRDGIATPATWRGSASLQNLKPDLVRIRLHLHGGKKRKESPRIYAIYFSNPAEIGQ